MSPNRVLFGVLLLLGSSFAAKCPNFNHGTTKLVCHYEGRVGVEDVDVCGCTHLVYTGKSRGDELADLSKALLERKPKLKILLRTNGKEKELPEMIKSSVIHGVDLYEAHSALNRTKIVTTAESIRSAIGSDAILMMTLPAQSELLAKYYDMKALNKPITLFSAETHALGEIENETYHPSRLSGVWDMLNTDSVVDLIVGLGATSSKLVITSPAKAFKFTLKNSTLSTPGSPTTEAKPTYLNQKELCKELNKGEKWTLERDQDLSAPYAFRDEKWYAFEDVSSLDVKGKYARVRGLAGLGLVSIDDDSETECGASLLQTLAKALGSQSRAPRGALLSSLENEILSVPHSSRLVDAVQLSPYRISRVVDSDGIIHAIREDTRTEFECQRQGYFVHPRTCNRFYRCVKFDQLSDEFTVFEFDCPAGLAFDSRYEVCVWPGSLSDGQACPGSSEIAPVPKSRFVCPETPGYYADPANCRWFFACLDHGKTPFSAYEFRCPFGLGFDESKLICDWPWLVPGCGNLGKYEASAYGHGSSVLTGASSYIGASANSVNIAAHQSLISGASTSNLVGIQNGYGSHSNLDNSGYLSGGLVEDGAYDKNNLYEIRGSAQLHSGSESGGAQLLSSNIGNVFGGNSGHNVGSGVHSSSYNSGVGVGVGVGVPLASHVVAAGQSNLGLNHGYSGSSNILLNSGAAGQSSVAYGNAYSGGNSDGAYYHDNSGDYKHDYSGEYRQDYSGEYQDSISAYKHIGSNVQSYSSLNGGVRGSSSVYAGDSSGQYKGDNSGAYYHDNGGLYKESFNNGDSGEYKAYQYGGVKYEQNSAAAFGKFGSSGSGNLYNANNVYVNHGSSEGQVNSGYNSGLQGYTNYKATGAAHVLTAGAINSGLVGKTTLVDSELLHNKAFANSAAQSGSYQSFGNFGSSNLNSQYSQQNSGFAYNKPAVVSSQSINHGQQYSVSGSGYNSGASYSNLEGNYNKYNFAAENSNVNSGQSYSFSTIAPVTKGPQAIYVTPSSQTIAYSSAHVVSPPKSSVAQIFGVQKPAVSYVQPLITVSSTPKTVVQQSLNLGEYNKPYVGLQQTYHTQNSYQAVTAAPSISPSLPSVQYQSQVYETSTPKVSIITYQKPAVTLYKNPLLVKNVTPVPTIASVPAFVQQPTYSSYISQPSTATYAKPTISSYYESNNAGNSQSYNVQGVSQQSAVYHNVQPSIQTYLQPSVQTYVQPSIQTYVQPAVQKNVQYTENRHQYVQNTAKPIVHQTYEQPSSISHQVFHQSSSNEQYVKPVISSTISPLKFETYEQKEYQQPYVYKAPEYLPPKVEIKQPISISSTPATISYQRSNSFSTIQQKAPAKIVYEQPIQVQQENVYVKPQYVQEPVFVSSTPAPIKYEKPNYVQQQNVYVKSQYVQEPVAYPKPVFVSSTPAPVKYAQHNVVHSYDVPKATISSTAVPIVYEEHSVVQPYQSPKLLQTVSSTPITYQVQNQEVNNFSYNYKAPTYTPPKLKYVQPVVSSTPSIVKFERTFNYEFPKVSQVSQFVTPAVKVQQPLIQVSTPAPFVYQKPINLQKQSQVVESFHISSNSNGNYNSYVSSTPKIVENRPISNEYNYEYQAPKIVQSYQSSTYLPPTAKVVQPKYTPTPASISYKFVTPAPVVSSTYKAPDYLPPVKTNFEYQDNYNVKYSTATPAPYKIISSTTSTPYYQPSTSININPIQEFAFKKIVSTEPSIQYKKPVLLQQNYEPVVKITDRPTYSSSTFGYDNSDQVNLLGFGTVGPDAGLVRNTGYSTIATEKYIPVTQKIITKVTPTYAPAQKFVEVTQSTIRKSRPKVAIVTKVNDFNPLIVKKLGAVCSCRSNVLRLRKPKPEYTTDNEYEIEYENDYDVPVNGDNDEEWTLKTGGIDSYSDEPIKYSTPTVATAYVPRKSTPVIKKQKITLVSSTLSPIIVPDESPSYDEEISYVPNLKSTLQPIIVPEENYPTIKVIPTIKTENVGEIVRVRPQRVRTRVKAVTVAPTLATVLIPERQSAVLIDSGNDLSESKPFDRYGPGGWRGRDETLQGTVDCKRVGLFRHPKHCNKFYSCRWDCTKKRFTLHVFNCPVQLSFDPSMGACNWPSQGPACQGDTLLPSGF